LHNRLKESGEIKLLKVAGTAKIVYLWNRYKRTVAVAASIGIFTAAHQRTGYEFSPKSIEQKKQVENLVRKLNTLEQKTNSQNRELNEVKGKIQQSTNPAPSAKFEGTCFRLTHAVTR
jgi:hypothetical protein